MVELEIATMIINELPCKMCSWKDDCRIYSLIKRLCDPAGQETIKTGDGFECMNFRKRQVVR